MNQHSKCLSCGALLRSGEFDWVLVEISKDCAWERSPLFDVAGAEILQQRDPHLNIALLEDRASVMFWRWLTAIRMGRTDPIRKSATEACCQRVLKPLSDGLYYRNADVDSVRTRGFIPGKETDSALVEVRWNASVARRGEPANTAPLREVVTRSLVVLERKHDAKSEIANGFGSAHCPHCGAPETISPDPGCAYCGAMMNDGAVSWALSDLMPMSSNEAIRLLATAREQDKDLNAFAYGRRATETPFASVQPQPAQKTFAAQALCRAELLAWTIMTARADGNISQSEREFIMLLALRCGVPLERIEMLWRAETLEASSPRDRGEAMAWLQELARLSLVDGQLSEKETASLVLLAQRAGLNEPEARVTISRMRSQLYDQMPIDLKAQWNKPAGT
jgi:hypothetical protein